jgi:hypothetical protein
MLVVIIVTLGFGFLLDCSKSRMRRRCRPVVIGRNTAATRARDVQKTSLPDRSSVPMATNNANIGLGWGWSVWFP